MRHRDLGVIFGIIVILSLNFVIAGDYIITTNASSLTVNVGTNSLFNISITNINTSRDYNVSRLNISLVGTGLVFVSNSNGTDTGEDHTFSNTSNVLMWVNEMNTDNLVANLSTNYFWFNATTTLPGVYNITVIASNLGQISLYNLSYLTLTVLDTIAPIVNQKTPANGVYTNSSILTCNISDNGLIAAVNISVWNSSGTLIYVNSSLLSGTANESSWNLSQVLVTDQNYTWVCQGIDSSGSSDINNTNNTFIYDSTIPYVLLTYPTNNTYLNSRIINLSIVASDTNLILINATIRNQTDGNAINSNSTANGSSNIYSLTTNISDDSNFGNYTLEVTATDLAGNTNTTNLIKVIIDTTNPVLRVNSLTTPVVTSTRNLSINLTTSDIHYASVNITVYNTTLGIVSTASSLSAITGTNLSVAVTDNGVYNVSIVTLDRAGNYNQTSFLWTSDSLNPTIYVPTPVNNLTYYVNQTIPIYFYVIGNVTPVSVWINNGTTDLSSTITASKSTNITYTVAGRYNITVYANNSLNNISSTTIIFNVTNLSSEFIIPNSSEYTVAVNVSNIVVPYGAPITSAILGNSSRVVTFDISQLMIATSVANVGSNNITLITTGDNNYTVFIPANLNITGPSGWDGKITMPVLNTSTFIEPEIDGYTVSDPLVVIETGYLSGEINFSSPVKIVFSGMTGKNVGWSRGSTSLTNIETVCDNITNPTIVDGISTKECYGNDGDDLVVWTTHFTTFGVYTSEEETSNTNPVSGSGGSYVSADSFWSSTYIVSDNEFKNGFARVYKNKERVKVIVDNKEHFVGVVALSSDSATVNVSSTPQQAVMKVNDEKKFDVNSDGYYEIDVILNSISQKDSVNVASLSIKSIYEKVPVVSTPEATPTTTETPENTAATPINPSESQSKGSGLIWFIIIVLIIVIVIVIVIVLIRKKRKKEKYVVFKRN